MWQMLKQHSVMEAQWGANGREDGCDYGEFYWSDFDLLACIGRVLS